MSEKRKTEMSDILEFLEFTNQFRSIRRTIWYKGVDDQERNGEHAFQLALVAWFVAVRCELALQLPLVIEYALVHDLVETYAGDTPAFRHPGQTAQPTHADKEQREREAFRRIARKWGPLFPSLVHRIARYRLQNDEESRFIYALDKLLAQLNIYADGGRTSQILQTTRDDIIAYKRPRVAKHPVVADLFEELLQLYARQPELFYHGAKAVQVAEALPA